MKIIQSIQFTEDETIVLRWADEDEQSAEAGEIHETHIMKSAQTTWEHVAYYASELRQDVEELLEWFLKYRKGSVRLP